jgi:hypothetical protein
MRRHRGARLAAVAVALALALMLSAEGRATGPTDGSGLPFALTPKARQF